MNLSLKFCKTLTVFTLATLAAVYSNSLAQVLAATNSQHQLTIDERLERVREKLEQKEGTKPNVSSSLSIDDKNLTSGEEDTLISQYWNDYWNNWSNWNNWYNWYNY